MIQISRIDNIAIETLSLDTKIRNKQLNDVMQVEQLAWQEGIQATRDKFECRAEVFPEGFKLAYEDGHPVGVTTSEMIKYSLDLRILSWEEVTNNGYISPRRNYDGYVLGHISEGNALYVVSLGVHPAYRRRGIGSLLIQQQQQLAVGKGLEYVVLGARLPGYAQTKAQNPALTAEDYVLLTDQHNEPYDQELRFYHRNGFEIHDLRPNYMEDDRESLNYGVIMLWRNSSPK
jgi:ribosomal protein S18 acetylase RimI-like enzyme